MVGGAGTSWLSRAVASLWTSAVKRQVPRITLLIEASDWWMLWTNRMALNCSSWTNDSTGELTASAGGWSFCWIREEPCVRERERDRERGEKRRVIRDAIMQKHTCYKHRTSGINTKSSIKMFFREPDMAFQAPSKEASLSGEMSSTSIIPACFHNCTCTWLSLFHRLSTGERPLDQTSLSNFDPAATDLLRILSWEITYTHTHTRNSKYVIIIITV